MACHLFGTKPLSEPMIGLLSIGSLGTIFNEILTKIQNFSFMKMHLKILSGKRRPFWPGGDKLTKWHGSWLWACRTALGPHSWPFFATKEQLPAIHRSQLLSMGGYVPHLYASHGHLFSLHIIGSGWHATYWSSREQDACMWMGVPQGDTITLFLDPS